MIEIAVQPSRRGFIP